MTKLFLILLIGLVFESTGIVFLKKGMTQIGDTKAVNAGEIARVVKTGVTNAYILLGVFFQALFFICLLILMAKNDISFLWPLTSLTFVFATVAAIVFLHERVTPIRWLGVLFIMLGAACISYSEHAKPRSTEPAEQAPAALK